MADLPFLKNKNKRKDGASMVAKTVEDDGSKGLKDQVTDEFIESIHKKDIAMLKDALRALVSIIKDEDSL